MFEYEDKYKSDGYKLIAGIDEAGRGPLAGPVVCAIAIMPLDKDKIIEGVNDSKKLSPKVREILYDKILGTAIAYQIEVVDNKTIDKINILNATKQGMINCINNISITPDIVLIDAVKINSDIVTVPIIKGDEKSYSIACASILAKVYRDRLMQKYDKVYPQYLFAKHKGYGTQKHIELLKKFGKCEIHRVTFIKNFLGDKWTQKLWEEVVKRLPLTI